MSRKPIKVIEPDEPEIDSADELQSVAAESVIDRSALERVRIVSAESPIRAGSISLDQSVIESDAFAGSTLPSAQIKDCIFDHADLAGATWTGARLVRTRFVGCRLTGFDLRLADLRDVVFIDCKMPDSLFMETTLTRVRFDECQMTNQDLSGATIESLAIRNCKADGLRLDGARISLLDLRGSGIEGISLDTKSTAGIVIEPIQSPAVAQALGVQVCDRDH
jgi:uncharacterized protein YjbI with pentapeptide repeats